MWIDGWGEVLYLDVEGGFIGFFGYLGFYFESRGEVIAMLVALIV